MTHTWLGLSMYYLQAYPLRMQMLFSWRKDSVPKRCFPDNNLGQEGSIALSSDLCWETRPTVLKGRYSRFKQAKSYLHILFLAHSGMPQNCHCLEEIRNSRSISAGHCWHWRAWWSLLFGTPIFASWVHYPDGHSSKETGENWSFIA